MEAWEHHPYDAYNMTLLYIFAINSGLSTEPGVHRCWTRAPAGVYMWCYEWFASSRRRHVYFDQKSRDSMSTAYTYAPISLNFAGAWGQHRCTLGSVDEPSQHQREKQSDIIRVIVDDVPRSMIFVGCMLRSTYKHACLRVYSTAVDMPLPFSQPHNQCARIRK